MKSIPYDLSLPDFVLDEGHPKAKDYILKIKDMPDAERPREKMISQGPDALSVSELIAVVLNTGTKKEDVMSMASRILKEYGERTLSMHKDPEKLAAEFDIPLVKAAQIVACAELGRRFFSKPAHGLTTIRNARDVWNALQDMRTLPKEHLRGIYLNTHHRVIHMETISIGTINTNIIHPREVFKPAIEHGAAAVILAHNHPSGITTPSEADIEITKHIAAAGKLIGIPLVDHVIIGRTKFTSIDIPYEN
jgi:DNA repair protein RadC